MGFKLRTAIATPSHGSHRIPRGRTWRSEAVLRHHPYHWWQLYGDYSQASQPNLPPLTDVYLNQNYPESPRPDYLVTAAFSDEELEQFAPFNEVRGSPPAGWSKPAGAKAARLISRQGPVL